MSYSYAGSRFIIKCVLKLLFRMQVVGKENIPQKGGVILAGNHVSLLDPLAVGAACPRKINFMAKQALFRNSVLSRWLFGVGAFPVKQKSADISALKQAMQYVKQGNILALFPEGGRNLEGDKSQPLAGIGFLVAKLKVPVIPVFVDGTDKIFPKGAKILRINKVKVVFGKSIYIKNEMPYQDIANLIMENIRCLGKNS